MGSRPQLPSEFERAAVYAHNGDAAWPREVAAAAARWFAGRGFAILGGERLRIDRGCMWGSVVSEWDTRAGDGWPALVERGLEQAEREIAVEDDDEAFQYVLFVGEEHGDVGEERGDG